MSTASYPSELLKRVAALVKTEQNLEIMDQVAVLHGYLELSAFRPDDAARKKEVDDAIGRLLETAARHPAWKNSLAEFVSPEVSTAANAA